MTRLQVRMPEHDRDRSLGHLAGAWIEALCRHGVGTVRGQEFKLDDDFYWFVVDCYALAYTGRRLYDTCVLSRPKGTAKSELAAFIVLFDALGPSRFAGFAKGGEVFEQWGFRYVYQPGEPMGRRLDSPIVRLLATEAGQAGNTYRNIRTNLEDLGTPLSVIDGMDSGVQRTLLPNSGKIEPSTSGAASKDGGLESMAVADETHLYITRETREMYATVDNNLPKRPADEPWMLATTTMYGSGEDSVAENQHKMALSIEAGTIKNPRFLYDHLEGGVIDDLSDEARLLEVLREAYADRDWIGYDRYIARANDPTKDPQRFRRLNLNQQAAAATAFVTDQELKAISGSDDEPVKPLVKGDVITIGFDYAPGNVAAKTGKRLLRIPDATAMVACRISDMSLHKIGIWEATEQAAMKGWNPPLLEIEQTFHDTMKNFKVIGVFADPTGFEGYLDRWTSRYHQQLKIVASAGRPMYRYMSGKSATQSGRDVAALYEAVASETVKLSPDAVLIRHLLNARRTSNVWGLALYKRTPDSPDKIDGAVAAVLAFAAAVMALNKGFTGQRDTNRSTMPSRID